MLLDRSEIRKTRCHWNKGSGNTRPRSVDHGTFPTVEVHAITGRASTRNPQNDDPNGCLDVNRIGLTSGRKGLSSKPLQAKDWSSRPSMQKRPWRNQTNHIVLSNNVSLPFSLSVSGPGAILVRHEFLPRCKSTHRAKIPKGLRGNIPELCCPWKKKTSSKHFVRLRGFKQVYFGESVLWLVATPPDMPGCELTNFQCSVVFVNFCWDPTGILLDADDSFCALCHVTILNQPLKVIIYTASPVNTWFSHHSGISP